MNIKTKTLRFLLFTVSVLAGHALGAQEIAHYPEGEKLDPLLANNLPANNTPVNSKKGTMNKRRFAPYLPPATEPYAPELRTATAGTRSPNNGYPVVTLLVPVHVALTVSEQPTLYWHISKSTRMPIVLTITETNAVEPLLEKHLQGAVPQGIHAFDLADSDIHLQTDKTYEWSVRLIDDLNDPSGDALARSFIKRVIPNAEVRALLDQRDPLMRAHVYARNGIWHDALATVSQQATNLSVRRTLHMLHKYFLEQVELTKLGESISVINNYKQGEALKL